MRTTRNVSCEKGRQECDDVHCKWVVINPFVNPCLKSGVWTVLPNSGRWPVGGPIFIRRVGFGDVPGLSLSTSLLTVLGDRGRNIVALSTPRFNPLLLLSSLATKKKKGWLEKTR